MVLIVCVTYHLQTYIDAVCICTFLVLMRFILENLLAIICHRHFFLMSILLLENLFLHSLVSERVI